MMVILRFNIGQAKITAACGSPAYSNGRLGNLFWSAHIKGRRYQAIVGSRDFGEMRNWGLLHFFWRPGPSLYFGPIYVGFRRRKCG